VPNKHGFLVCFPATAVEQKQLHGISCSLDHGASFGESPKLFYPPSDKSFSHKIMGQSQQIIEGFYKNHISLSPKSFWPVTTSFTKSWNGHPWIPWHW